MIVFFSISPLGSAESVSKPVSEVIDLIAQSGLEYQITAMGTLIEGPREDIFDLLNRCHAQLKTVHNRVTSKILIDDRGDGGGQLRSKVASIERHLGISPN